MVSVFALVLLSPVASAISPESAREILFAALPHGAAISCDRDSADAEIRCLLRSRYVGDGRARRLALELYARTGSVAGLEVEHDMDGGYRGTLHLVPHLPVGRERKHLRFLTEAMTKLDDFLSGIEAEAGRPPKYRWRHLAFRFFRSAGRRTPAAYASDWEVAYNVRGTLNHSVPVVRNLMFHEIFHLNDQAARNWSERALGPVHARIVDQCGSRADCLVRFVPGWLKVRGGTYYAFMPGNGVEEFAADLAGAYLKEQLAVLMGRAVRRPFKCGPPESREAWKLLVDEFFAGVDRVPACGS